MKTVFVVVGETGACPSDWTSWVVCAHEREADAKAHADRAAQRAKEIFAKYRKWYEYDEESKANEYDQRMQFYDVTATYEVVEVEYHAGHFSCDELTHQDRWMEER